MLQYKLRKLLNTRVYSNTGACVKVITKANNILNGISSSTVCTEVIQSAQGMEYLLGRQLHTHARTHKHTYKQAGALRV